MLTDLRDGVDHVEAHLNAAEGVVVTWFRQPAHTVVAVAQYLKSPFTQIAWCHTARQHASYSKMTRFAKTDYILLH